MNGMGDRTFRFVDEDLDWLTFEDEDEDAEDEAEGES